MSHLARALLADLGPDELAELAEKLEPYMRVDAGWLDVKAAAAYAGCSVPALRYAMRNGDLPYEQRVSGGKVFFRRSALDHWRSSRSATT